MDLMAAPSGWYPDPQNPHRKRYWDGVRWTVHVQNPPAAPATSSATPPEPQSGYPTQPQTYSETSGYPQGQLQSTATSSSLRNSRHIVLWMAVGMVITLLIGGSLLLLLNRPKPNSPASQSTTSGASTGAPAASEASRSSGAGIKVGDVLRGENNCPTTANDARGELTEGRIASPGGLSYPAVQGFSPSPVNYGFIHQSNSMTKSYPGRDGQAVVTVGVLKKEDGFDSATSSAVRVVQCVIASPAFYNNKPAAEVTRITENRDDGTVVLQVRVPVENGAGDTLAVAIYPEKSRKQIVLSLVPQDDSTALAAVNTALAELSLNS